MVIINHNLLYTVDYTVDGTTVYYFSILKYIEYKGIVTKLKIYILTF